MMVRTINVVLVGGCLLFVFSFGAIPDRSLDGDAESTFRNVSAELTSPAGGMNASATGAAPNFGDEFPDGCFVEEFEGE